LSESDGIDDWLLASDRVARDDVNERLLVLTRRLRPEHAEVGGHVVLRHPHGGAFAAVDGDRVLVRVRDAPGTLDAVAVDGLDGWIAVDPWPADVGFRRGTDVLGDLLAHAYAASAAGSDAGS